MGGSIGGSDERSTEGRYGGGATVPHYNFTFLDMPNT